MEVAKTDLTRCETALAALKRGKFELDGTEVMAVAQSITWLSTLHERLKLQLEAQAARPPADAPPDKPLFNDTKEPPQPSRGRKPKA